MTIASLRRTSTALAVLGLAVLGLSASASAAPTITLKTKALPIPGFRGTGDILGAGAVIEAEYTISGTEYGGFPPPLTGVKYYGPAGAKIRPNGFATCAPTVLKESGPGPCPKTSIAGPKGSATGIVSFGTERVQETVSVQPFFAPGGNLQFFTDGTTPVSLEILSTGNIVNSSPPFGPSVFSEVPLVESVPGAPDASVESINVLVGAAYKHGKKTISYLIVPKKCPKGGLPVKTIMEFLGGATAEASYKMPCPKK